MSIGVYGTKRPADVDPSDIEVVLIYTPTRNATDTQEITKFPGVQVVKPIMSTDTAGASTLEILGGLYNLVFPRNIVARKGYYTVYVRPTQMRAVIEDCGELASFPDVKGLVFNVDKVDPEFVTRFTNNGLDGFRIEYLTAAGTKIPNLFRIVTSSFICEPIQVNTANSSQKAVKYVANNSGNLLFTTITPNAAPSFKPTAAPFLGTKGQNVIITNTNFNPVILEFEVVDYDVESLAVGMFGSQSKSVDDGIYTIYNFDGSIHSQYDIYEVRDTTSNKLFEVRRRRETIDTTKSLNNIP
jgi:hypothetical protein